MDDDHTNEQRRKASLRGKGREIFLGAQETDAQTPSAAPTDAEPSLTSEETAALLGLLAESAPADAQEPLPSPDEVSAPLATERRDALPLGEREPAALAAEEGVFPEPPPVPTSAPTPKSAEVWQEENAPPQPEMPSADGDEGGLAPLFESQPTWEDPFLHRGKRPTADTLFPKTETADPSLLYMLIDNERIRQLEATIEHLLKELATNVRGPAEVLDAYQQDLLHASSLLLASRENYDDARAIVYRVRGELNRQRQIEADIARYRPLLLNYYLGWGVTLVVLFLLKALFVGVAEAVGVYTLSALYYPALFGVGGALIAGLRTLERHTSILRDFDPIHISWYLLNPLLGGVMGVLMFLLLSVANEDLLREMASFSEVAIAYLLCVVAGMNQSHVLRRLDQLRQRFGGGGARDTNADTSATPPQST